MRTGSVSAASAAANLACCSLRPEWGPRHDSLRGESSRKPVHARGKLSRRSVCPDGAVSNTMWSQPSPSPASRPANSSNAAISVVHAPASCSWSCEICAASQIPRYGAITRSRYSSVAASGSMFSANSPGAPGTGVGWFVRATPSIWSRFEAGSVLTSSSLCPASASLSAVAHDSAVLPTPPLPVKNRNRVGASRKPMGRGGARDVPAGARAARWISRKNSVEHARRAAPAADAGVRDRERPSRSMIAVEAPGWRGDGEDRRGASSTDVTRGPEPATKPAGMVRPRERPTWPFAVP